MIETDRLILRPLTHQQLVKYLRCDNSLENEFNLKPNNRVVSIELKDAIEQTILPNVADNNKSYLFSTLWTAILKSENQMVGDICLYGEPNENGEVEIGYGTYVGFQNLGLMTEMVHAFIHWIKKQAIVKLVVASTGKNNAASIRVLEKNNFQKVGGNDKELRWTIEL